MLEISERQLDRGLYRLLRSPRDVTGTVLPPVTLDRAPPAHRVLFSNYVSDLRPLARAALDEWNAEVHAVATRTHDLKAATQQHWETFPAGPASRPEFVALIRRYWLACDALNRESGSAVAPEEFLLAWPLEASGRDDDVVRIIACMPYWPIGMNEQGRWV